MKIKFLIIIILLSISIGGIAFFSSFETSFLLLDASELASNPSKYDDDNLRVRGFVKIGSVVREGRNADFILEMESKEIKVHFTGKEILPDAFKEGARARVDGKYKDGILLADHVEAKCASKYEADYTKEK